MPNSPNPASLISAPSCNIIRPETMNLSRSDKIARVPNRHPERFPSSQTGRAQGSSKINPNKLNQPIEITEAQPSPPCHPAATWKATIFKTRSKTTLSCRQLGRHDEQEAFFYGSNNAKKDEPRSHFFAHSCSQIKPHETQIRHHPHYLGDHRQR